MACFCRGIVAVGLFATRSGVAAAYPSTPLVDWGVFYGGSGAQLGIQLLGVLVIAATTLFLNGIGFAVLKALGCLRVPKEARSVPPHCLSNPMPFNAHFLLSNLHASHALQTCVKSSILGKLQCPVKQQCNFRYGELRTERSFHRLRRTGLTTLRALAPARLVVCPLAAQDMLERRDESESL